MKKEELPQDLGALGRITTEVCYVVDESGRYSTALSNGWTVKSQALDVAWEDVHARIEAAAEKVKSGEASPILFFMELRVMDVPIMAAYTGFWKWQVKRHLRQDVFRQMSPSKLQKYADLFEISQSQLKTMNADEA